MPAPDTPGVEAAWSAASRLLGELGLAPPLPTEVAPHGLDDLREVEGLPAGTVAHAGGVTLAAAALLARLGEERVDVSCSGVAAQVLLPAVLAHTHADGTWPRAAPPLPWPPPEGGRGALACDLRSPGDEDVFERLLGVVGTQGAPLELAAAAQEWRLPVVDFVPRDVAAAARRAPAWSGLADTAADAARGGGAGDGSRGRPALAGITVIDMTSMWAGPLATWLLACAGARVLKIEPACRLDGLRGGGGVPRMFEALNRGNERLDLDLRDPAARRCLIDLVAGADLVVDSFSPRVMPNLGMAREQLVAATGRPDLLTLSIPAFPDGPRHTWAAYGGGVHAASGLADVGGGVFRPAALAYPDPLAGLTAFAVALGLLVHRNAGRQPAHVEVPMLDAIGPLLDALPGTALATPVEVAAAQLAAGLPPGGLPVAPFRSDTLPVACAPAPGIDVGAAA